MEENKYTKSKIAEMIGEYFFTKRAGKEIDETKYLPEDLPKDLRDELESTYLLVDLVVKIRKIAQGEKVENL